MSTARDKKKSNFVQSTSVPSGATFDFVANGTNYKIAVEDMIAAFGAFGTLEQAGDPLQVPILQQVGTVNKIRNAEAGSGILTEVSPLDGLRISHNIVSGATGVPIFTNVTGLSPIIRSLIAGSGINIAADGNRIQIAATEVVLASNIVIVNEMANFPTPVAGVITLEDNTAYLIGANLSTAYRFVLSNQTVLYGADSSVSGLEYTGSGTFLTALNSSAKVTLLNLKAETGTLFDITATEPGHVFQLINASVESCNIIGTVTGIYAIQITDVSFKNIITSGITFYDSIGVFVGARNLFDILAGTIFDLGTAVFSLGFLLEQNIATLASGSYFLSGLIDSGNLAADADGSLVNVLITGLGTPLENITTRDARWNFFEVTGINNSVISVFGVCSGMTVSIAGTSTPVKLDTNWTATHASRFTGTVDGAFTYIGRGSHVNINVSISAELSSLTGTCNFYLYKNGLQIAESKTKAFLDAGSTHNISIVWQEDLETDDFIELWVENITNTQDVVIENATIGFYA